MEMRGVDMKEQIMLFIPMYNCEKQIPRVLKKLTAVRSYFSEIVVIDNRSNDRSIEVAKKALEEINDTATTLLRNAENYNLGGSHKVAFAYALDQGYDYVVVLHGDDQGNIEDIVPHLQAETHRHYDSFLGSRFHKGSKLVGYSTFRTVGNIIFNFIISVVTHHWITDMGSGLNIYKTSYLADRFYLPFPNDLTFNVFMLFYGIWKRSPFAFFPLTWREDDQVSNARIFRQAWIILGLTWRYSIGAKRLFSKSMENLIMDYSFEEIYANKPKQQS